MDYEKSNSNSSSKSSLNDAQVIAIHDSESSDSAENEPSFRSSKLGLDINSTSTAGNESTAPEELTRHELRKLSLDQNGTFMADFDPEKSKREMRKMNRRLYTKESRKNQLYDDKGVFLETSIDICDCLEKDCPGCHFPCPRCTSPKCGTDCRCNRKYTIEMIEVEGMGTVYNFPS
ncbi:ARL14 effector protein-like [Physella acuta]|uniref:ARL14 effector protein-like n=1 Tax=Physella acuta TaxID=109671 RepID=UPI0027DBA4B3|nr:ARL14 effector protein-like [Physella acuta]